MELPKRIFITGTDTGVGKTMVAAMLMSGLTGFYWKPIQSGLDDITDTEWVKEKTGLPDSHFYAETYRLTRPLSPHISAAKDGTRIDLEKFMIPDIGADDHLIIEGAGGIMVPLNEKEYMLDLMKRIEAKIILVARSSLGTINHTLLSLSQLRSHSLSILGVVMNGERNAGNRDAIERYGNIKVLAEIEHMDNINPQIMEQCYKTYFYNKEPIE